MEYYLAVKRNKVPVYATTWMNLTHYKLKKPYIPHVVICVYCMFAFI